MKPFMAPPIWIAIGFLTGWLYAKPNPLLAIVWATTLYTMTLWIMRDVERNHHTQPEQVTKP